MNHPFDKQTVLQRLPDSAGCYIFKNSAGIVIYVGKAISIKKRVQSYFVANQATLTPKTKLLVSHIHEIEFVLSENESAALVLENNLIKAHNPKYNIRLKSDKSYPYIYFNTSEKFIRPSIVRRPNDKLQKLYGTYLFGPFPVGHKIWDLLKTLIFILELRDCSLAEFKKRKFPCLLYQMQKCSAPCVGLITLEDYQKKVDFFIHFLQGKSKELLDYLNNLMNKSAESENFEKAATLRDIIQDLAKLHESENIQYFNLVDGKKNWDLWCTLEDKGHTSIVLKEIRNGTFMGIKNWCVEIGLFSDLDSLLYEYYASNPVATGTQICKNVNELPAIFTTTYNLGLRQAQLNLQTYLEKNNKTAQALKILQNILGIKDPINSIEAFDVAVLQGESPCGSCVRFEDGEFIKSKYRYYKLEKRPEGNNDFAMLVEILKRRLTHGDFPDLLLIDGGSPQLAYILSKNILPTNLPMIGLAKLEEKLIFTDKAILPYSLSNNQTLGTILCGLRDEAHRFCRKLHHQHEKKRLLRSQFKT